MKDQAQLEASIERFQRGFWKKCALDRPPVGIAPDRVWQPILFLRAPLPEGNLQPAAVSRGLVRTEYEDSFMHRAVVSDDWMPFVAAWRAVPWLEAMCGCVVRCSAGALAAGHFVSRAEDLARVAIPGNTEWVECLRRQTAELAASAPPQCWISPTILRGVSDVLGAMRGLHNFFLDLYDDPQALTEAAARVNRLHLDVLQAHFSLVPRRLGGYGHIYGYWAPEPTTVIQEDAAGMCSPAVYQRLFMEHDAELVRQIGRHVLFHLHSTGYRHYRSVLEIPRIAGLEITVEAGGPPLAEMIPDLRLILERSRLILSVDGHFGQLRDVLRKLPKEGLYLIISDRFISADKDFREFVRANW